MSLQVINRSLLSFLIFTSERMLEEERLYVFEEEISEPEIQLIRKYVADKGRKGGANRFKTDYVE